MTTVCPEIECDLLVIGTGMAGMAAVLFAAQRGIDTVQVGMTGELNFASGLLDLLGMHPVAKAQIWSDPWEGIAQLIHDQPDHPYARIGVDTIRAAMETFIGFLNTADLPYRCHAHQNAQVITPVGTLKTTYARPESMAWIDRALADRPPCLLVDFPGLKGFSAHQIKAVLHDRWPDLRTARLPFPGLTGELQTERMARRLETPAARAQLADAIRPQLGDTRGVGLPAVLGIARTQQVFTELQQALDVPVFEIPTMLPAVTGLRLRECFERQLPQMGVRARYQQKVLPTPSLAGDGFILKAGGETPEVQVRARAIVRATTHYRDPKIVAEVSRGLGEAMPGIDGMASLDEMVAAAGMADAPPAVAPAKEEVALPAPDIAEDEMTEVAFVAKPLASSPLVNVSFLVHTGAALDPEGKKGLAALTAAMLTQGGSQAKTIDEINAAMFPMAAGFGSQVDKEMTRLAGQVHKDNLDAWYELVRGQLLFPAWSEKDFDRIKTQMTNAIRTDLVGNNDEELGKEFLYTQIYGAKHPYGSLTMGATGDLASITLDDVKAFYREHYTVANMTVGLSGGYPESFPVRVSRDLQMLEAGEKAALEIPPAPVVEGRHATIIQKETPGVAVSFGFPIDLRRGDPDWVALWLMRSYFGEHRSTNAHLFQRIRETRGMNYGDYAYIEYFPRGMFQFHPDTNLGRQQQIFQVWIRPVRSNNDAHFATRVAMYELDKLIENGMTESDFEATRAYLSKFVSLLTDGQSRQLGYAMDSQYYGTGDFADYVRDGLAKLTLDDVNRVIRENLDTSNMQYVFVTRDGDGLRERLLSDERSPMTYDADLPQEVLDEDLLIDNIELGIESAEVVPADEVFN